MGLRNGTSSRNESCEMEMCEYQPSSLTICCRLEELQSCGVSMYDDFIELRQGAAERLEKSLNEDYANIRSNSSRHSSNTSR